MLDIWGPARVHSIGGSRYTIIFVDDASSWHSPYYLSDQRAETTVKTLELFTNMAERQMGKKLRKIHCDNEFDCLLWWTWAGKWGVIIELMAPYSSAANGVAEQTFRVIFGSVWILLLEVKMAHALWAKACDYAVKVANLLPTSWHPGKVPEEVWSGKKQTVGHLWVWGSTCYAKIPAAKEHSKLGPRGQKGRFIGLVGHRTYRIVLNDIPGNKIIVSHWRASWCALVKLRVA